MPVPSSAAGEVLVLDAAGAGCSVALVRDGRVASERRSDAMRGQASALPAMAAAVLAGGGMAVLAWGAGGGAQFAWTGYALLLLAVCGEAGYVLLAKANSGRVAVLPAAFWMQAFGALSLAPFAWGAVPSPAIGALLAFHSLTASVAAVVLWYAGLRRVPGSVAGVFAGLLPLTAGATAVLVLHEPLTLAHVAGAALMLLSMVLATAPARATTPA